ncbi:hypothetical protein HYS84_01075 [Candidatus Saccharibacteria bacterium]|nr:hypothetical protein [Candidatus Saccharibacteria bacterium]
MSRSNRSNSEYSSYIGHRPTVDQLGWVGLSVFRSFEPGQLDPVFKTLEEELGGIVIRVRGQGMEKPPGVSLLEIDEVRRQRTLGRVSVKDALNELYHSVETLRQEIEAIPSRIQFLGSSKVKNKVLVAMFEEETESQLAAERTQILEVLEGMAETPDVFNWKVHKRPCISLARMTASQVEKATAEVRYNIAQALPQTVDLHRATLYNPASN